MAENYGKHGSVLGHEVLISKIYYPEKRKRRMCRCGCRKKATHVQFANGVAMNEGCEKAMNAIKKSSDDYKVKLKERRDGLYKTLGIENLKDDR